MSPDAYLGRTVDEVTAVLGPPAVRGDRRSWQARIATLVAPQHKFAAPTIESTDTGVRVAPGTSVLRPAQLEALVCFIEARADTAGRIVEVRGEGPGCDRLPPPSGAGPD